MHPVGAVGSFARRPTRPGICRSALAWLGAGLEPRRGRLLAGGPPAHAVCLRRLRSRGAGGAGRRKPARPGCSSVAFTGARRGPSHASLVSAFAGLLAPGPGDGRPVTTGRRRLGDHTRTSCATGGPDPAARLRGVVSLPWGAGSLAGGTGLSRRSGGRLLWSGYRAVSIAARACRSGGDWCLALRATVAETRPDGLGGVTLPHP